MDLKKQQTPSQTIGPYFAYGLTPEQYGYNFKSWASHNMVPENSGAEQIEISGTVFDGAGIPIDDAMLELWQDDGEYRLFGRCGTGTDKKHRFLFRTIKPKAVHGQAPFIHLILFMRGQLLHAYTRIYFSDESELNKGDEVLNAVAEGRRDTLIALKNNGSYNFDIHMQGSRETVFFDL